MESFYGGRKGSSFIISKSFSTKEEMDEKFAEKNYKEVNYGEYALVVGNCKETGEVYLRTLDGSQFMFSLPGALDAIAVSNKQEFKYENGSGDYVPRYTLLMHFKNEEITSNISYIGTNQKFKDIKNNWLECGSVQTPSSLFNIYATVTSLPSTILEGSDESDCIILLKTDGSRSIYYWDTTKNSYQLFVEQVSIDNLVAEEIVQIGNINPTRDVQMMENGLYFKTIVCKYAE